MRKCVETILEESRGGIKAKSGSRQSGALPARYFFANGEQRTRTSRLRLYLPHQLVELLLVVGFEEVSLYGDESGDPLTIDSPRCIAVARKARS